MIRKPKPSLLRRFRKFISFQPHLQNQFKLIGESKNDRIYRILSDKSNPSNIDLSRRNKNRRSLSKIFNIRIFSPIQNLMLIWFIFVFIAILYYYIQMGIVLTFGKKVWQYQLHTPVWISFDCITCLIFFADMLICLNCGFLYRGMIILDDRRITMRYLAYGFIVDLISIIIIILCPVTGQFYLNYAKFWLLLKLIRLSQIDDFFLRKFNINRIGKALYVIFKMMVIIFLLSHLVGLIFYAMDYYYLTEGIYPPDFCWLYTSTAYSPIIELDYSLQYLYVLYWGVNTISTISYGDIAPLNPPQTNYVIATFVFGFMVYAYIVNQIIKIILWARQNQDQFNSQMILIETYMNKMGISKGLKQNVCDYLNFLHKQEKGRDLELESAMRQKMPEHLRIQLLKSAYSIFYDKMFDIFKTQQIIKIFFHLNERKYTANQTIFQQSARASKLLLLNKGNLSLKIKQGVKIHTIYNSMAQNQLIGHYQMFSNQKWPYSAVSKRSSLIYSIDRVEIMNEINQNLALRQKIKLIQYQIIHKNNCQLIFHSCYFCYQAHNFKNCPKKFPHFNPKISVDNKGQKKQRSMYRNKKNGLKCISQLSYIHKLHQNKNFKLIMKIEKRLGKIKKRIQQDKNKLEVDTAFDWNLYEPKWNLSNLKEIWNAGTQKNCQLLKKNIWE